MTTPPRLDHDLALAAVKTDRYWREVHALVTELSLTRHGLRAMARRALEQRRRAQELEQDAAPVLAEPDDLPPGSWRWQRRAYFARRDCREAAARAEAAEARAEVYSKALRAMARRLRRVSQGWPTTAVLRANQDAVEQWNRADAAEARLRAVLVKAEEWAADDDAATRNAGEWFVALAKGEQP